MAFRLLDTGEGSVPAIPVLPVANVVFSASTQSELNSSTRSWTAVVSLTSPAPAGGVTIAWAVTGTGANPLAASDFSGGSFPSGTLSISAGVSSGNITFSTAGDTTPEADETGTLTLSSPTNCTLGVSTAGFTVSNDDVPTNSSLPAITGTTTEGSTLTVSTGGWVGFPSSYTYRWFRNGTAISGATSSTYLLVTADVGATITAGVTASNAAGASTEAVSSGVGPITASGVSLADLASIDASGEFAQWDGTPPASDVSAYQFDVTRSGFNSAGGSTTFTETLKTTIRVRQQYPNNGSLEASKVGLTKRIYADDTISGVTNNSTLTSPKPLVEWLVVDRLVIGNTHRARVSAFHIQGIAAVRFTWSDGTNTVTSTVSTASVRTTTRSGFALIEYDSGDVSISSLSDGLVTLNVEVWPKIGASASKFDSSAISNAWDVRPRYYRKHVSMAAAPVHAFWSNLGSDSTGVASTTEATASASPFLTPGAAMTAIRTLNNSTYGVDGVDGGILHPKDSATWTSPSTNRVQLIAAMIMEPATGAGRFSLSASSINMRVGSKNASMPDQSYIFRRMDITNTGTTSFLTNSGGATTVHMIDCDLDFGASATGNLCNTNNWTRLWDCDLSNLSSGSAYLSGATPVVGYVGCTSTSLNAGQLLAFNIQACNFENCRIVSSTTLQHQGVVISTRAEKYLNSSNPILSIGQPTAQNRGAVIGNFETGENNSVERNFFAIASDGTTYNTNHILLWHNSIAGFDGNCRSNLGYNDVTNTNNLHQNWSMIGVVQEGRNPCKSDTFVMDSTAPNDYSGNWGFLFGVDCRGNLVGWYPTTTGHLEYLGEGSMQPTDRLSNIDPLWTSKQASTDASGTPTSGGTNFTLQSGSPAKEIVNNTPLPWTIAGAARPSTDADAGSR